MKISNRPLYSSDNVQTPRRVGAGAVGAVQLSYAMVLCLELTIHYFIPHFIIYGTPCSDSLIFLSCCSNFKINLKGKHSFAQMWKQESFLHRLLSGIYDWPSMESFSLCGSGDQIQAIDHAGQPLCWAVVPSAYTETFHRVLFYKYRIWFIFVEVACPLSWCVHYCSVVMIKYHYQLTEQQFSTWGVTTPLWVEWPFHRGHPRPSENTDLYITLHNSETTVIK